MYVFMKRLIIDHNSQFIQYMSFSVDKFLKSKSILDKYLYYTYIDVARTHILL